MFLFMQNKSGYAGSWTTSETWPDRVNSDKLVLLTKDNTVVGFTDSDHLVKKNGKIMYYIDKNGNKVKNLKGTLINKYTNCYYSNANMEYCLIKPL